MNNSYQNLKHAQQKFRDCITNIRNGVAASVKGASLREAHMLIQKILYSEQLLILRWLDKPILVPLTSSLYVPGRLADTEHVLVDVGTGFFVEKSTADAETFYNGKIEELGKNIKDLENIVNGKSNNLRMVEEVLKQKILASQQAGQASSSAK